MWAVQTVRREWDEDEFFHSGVETINWVFDEARRAGVERLPVPGTPNRVLDFGCGVGRLSLALAGAFARVEGIDISESMVRNARARAAKRLGPDQERVGYQVNDAADLVLFADGDFGLVLSLICLQHMRQVFAKRYIAEFCRVTSPGGIIFFQLPTRRTTAMLRLRGTVGRSARRIGGRMKREAVMEMHGTSRCDVERILDRCGVDVIGVRTNDLAPSWESLTYVGRKRGR
ncbi:MAG: class I SAM-dependent methyltransferase [Solirubrobacterales bacterium]|nr:class I SAM-dependent methyltransferase [Solirubrobacterales bacterium]HMT05865.1 class I SAM-dependent methyltransferase [Solirubrobacterales bacterium]